MSLSGGDGEHRTGSEAPSADSASPWTPVEPTCCFSMDGGGEMALPSLGELGWAGGAITLEVVVRWASDPASGRGGASAHAAESLWCRQEDATGPQDVVEAEPFLVGESNATRAGGGGSSIAIAAEGGSVVASVGERGSGLILGSMPPTAAGSWRHLCLAAGAGTCSLYVDGAPIGSDEAAPLCRSTRIRVGGLGFRGDVLLLRLWSACLPADACARLAAHPLLALHPLERLVGGGADVVCAVGPGLVACAGGSVSLLGRVALRPLLPGALPQSWARSVLVNCREGGVAD